MYVHHIQFGVRPDVYEDWAVHARNSLGSFARMEGLALMRVYRDAEDPTRFLSLRVWRSKADSDRALASPEMAAVSQRAKAGKYGDGFQTISSEFMLWEHTFGREGPESYRTPQAFTNHISVESPNLEEQPLWPAYVRNCASVFARQKGLVSYEVMRDLSDPNHHLVLRTWRDKQASRLSPEFEPNEEVKLVVTPAKDLDFYRNTRRSRYSAWELIDAVYGPTGASDYVRFMQGLKPA